MTAALGIRAVGSATVPARTLRLARLSTLNGPYRVETEDAVSLGPADDVDARVRARLPARARREAVPGR